MTDHYISIWFFIGALMLFYGLLIAGAGIYHAYVPPAQTVALAELHAPIWWGALMAALGAFYCVHFRPGK